MERALSLELLVGALGARPNLPSSEDLQNLLAVAEIELLQTQGSVSDALIETAWYLHAVASVSGARQRYSLARQRQASQVSAHIFDLALNREDQSELQRLSFGFGSAVGFHGCGQGPNASAVARRLIGGPESVIGSVEDVDSLALRIGISTLSLDVSLMSRLFTACRQELSDLESSSGVPRLSGTALGPLRTVLDAADSILVYLTRGRQERLDDAAAQLAIVANGESGNASLNLQWVAARLRLFIRGAATSSLWNSLILPSGVPDSVRHAFTLSTPAVLALWDPQVNLLRSRPSPFSPETQRLVVSVPTSGGKTLLAQILAIEELERTGSSVCFVTPTRSLAREIRSGLAPRLRVLRRRLGPEQPDYVFEWSAGLIDLESANEPSVDVMTPERLSNLMRRDPEAVLDKYSLFIFDEAQSIGDGSRGIVLEALITTLNQLTRRSSHRMALVSAAMGNYSAISSWLDPTGPSFVFSSEWRGPRRLHAVFNTVADWSNTSVEYHPKNKLPFRHNTRLTGQMRVMLSEGRQASFEVRGSSNWILARQSRTENARFSMMSRDAGHSTPNYVIAGDMIANLGNTGGLLAVASTRRDAQNLARGIASNMEPGYESVGLQSLVEERLGSDHPLVYCLRRGVGFHHAGLPLEVLEALESAMRSGVLNYLTCTSTLTDGVNLPVRTVVIYDQNVQKNGYGTPLRGSKLVNAIGRAGRAGKETEGWVILIRAGSASAADFEILSPSREDLAVVSVLADPHAFSWVEALDDLGDLSWDLAVTQTGTARDFVTFIWSHLSTLELLGSEPLRVDVSEVVRSTLGHYQGSVEVRRHLEAVAEVVRRAYVNTDPVSRCNWARTGMSVPSARLLETYAIEIVETLSADADSVGDLWDPLVALRLLEPAISLVQTFSESPAWSFRESRSGAKFDVPVVDVAGAWLSGDSLPAMADRFLGRTARADFRIEQMVDAVSEHFEHYLSWALGALVEIVNTLQSDRGSEETLCPEIGGYIRYGVDTPLALDLMLNGIRSRRLASAVAGEVFHRSGTRIEAARSLLASMTFLQWREVFEPTRSEIVDLLEVTREPRESLLRDLIEDGFTSCVLDLEMLEFAYSEFQGAGGLSISRVNGRFDVDLIGVYNRADLLGTVRPKDHYDIESILNSGLPVSYSLAVEDFVVFLNVRLDD